MPPHPPEAWTLTIVGNEAKDPNDGMGAFFTHFFQIAENRAVDLPLPSTSAWKCRVSAAHVVVPKKGDNFVTRDLACSNDGWKTYVEATASYCFEPTCNVEENSVELGLPMPLNRSGGVGTLRLAARKQVDVAKFPELP